jgi:hypothetical protein
MTTQTIADVVGPSRSLGCVIEISSSMFVPGVTVRDSDHARSWFAVGPDEQEETGKAEEIAELLRHAGRVSVVENVQATKWMKLISNATTLVSTALFGLSIHEGAASHEGRDLMLRSAQDGRPDKKVPRNRAHSRGAAERRRRGRWRPVQLPVTADTETTLDDPKVDAVILATPHRLHGKHGSSVGRRAQARLL